MAEPHARRIPVIEILKTIGHRDRFRELLGQ
jgi:hypothetical protein